MDTSLVGNKASEKIGGGALCRTLGRTLARLGTVLVVVALLAGCRFRFPTGPEGQQLQESGAFPGEVPAWVNQNKELKPRPSSGAGFVPQQYSSPRLKDTAPPVVREEPGTREKVVRDALGAREEGQDAGLGRVRTPEEEADEATQSPLARIEQTCPGLESSVADALQITNPQERIRSYEALTLRCPTSADLWLWLAKDYEAAARLPQANRSYERVLTLDPTNAEARERLTALRERLNQPAAGQAGQGAQAGQQGGDAR